MSKEADLALVLEMNVDAADAVESTTPRRRKASEANLQTIDGDGDAGIDTGPVRRSARSRKSTIAATSAETPSRPQRTKRVKKDTESIEYLLTNRKSKLAKTGLDLKKIFSYDVFQMLCPEEQEELAALVPSVDRAKASGSHDPPLTERFFKHSAHLRECISTFQDNLAAGLYEPEEQEAMIEDVETTKKVYDAWKEQHYEEVWGDQLDQELSPEIASIAKALSLKDMWEEGLLRQDDELVYKRTFGKLGVTVEKSVKVTSIDGSLNVQSGKLHWKDIEAPTRLETLILDQDKRVTKRNRPNGNAWKVFRIRRDGKDLGKLWEVRNDLAIKRHGKAQTA